MGSLWYEMTNHRPYDRTISYVECHDQCINGDDAMIWRLLGDDMYHYMSVGTESWNVSRGLAFYRLMRLITLATADAGYLNFMGNEFGHPEWLDAEAHAHRQWYLGGPPRPQVCGPGRLGQGPVVGSGGRAHGGFPAGSAVPLHP